VDQADVKREKLASESGAVIDEVTGESPAAKAGFKAGDVVVEFDGERVRSARQLTRLVRETPAGRQVRTTVTRDGRRVELQVTPEAGPGARLSRDLRSLGRGFRFEMPELPQHFDFELLMRPGRLGVQTSELTPQLAEYFGTRDGVLVTRVDPDTPAARAGLKAGDVITAVGGHQIDSAAELRRELNRSDSGAEVELTVMRDRKELTLKATIESTSRRLRRLPARRTI
jgi:serine protease Do